ncbi:MAG TPA: hypothetical protein VJ850_08330 [Candidatus Limnocylindrales bacterium]|nr:hypothetical protein [Candidatus Limnocylindrales bacterium]
MPAKGGDLHADLDGTPIDLVDVGKWYCHDFAYPAIHCFSDPAALEAATSSELVTLGSNRTLTADATTAAAGVNYVIVYEFTTYQGAYMYMSEDYSILATIGWNDRISSFVVLNSQSGAFWTNWLYSGTRYNFCCNQSVASLGTFNDTFSSVFRN